MSVDYDSYESGSTGDGDETTNLITTTYSTFEGDFTTVFGNDGQFGQSLGVVAKNLEITDGCLYADANKGKLKLFSWQESNDMSIQERIERDMDPEASDASDFIRKSYAGNSKSYDLIAARVPEQTDDDGNTIVEASSVYRDFDTDGDGLVMSDYGEFEDLDGEPISLDVDVIMWYDGSEDYGPSVSARTIAETLTSYGENAVTSEDDINNWLADTSGDNILRDDLQDRRLRMFTVQRPGDSYTYNLPIFEDVETGGRIKPNNRMSDGDGDSGSSNSGSSGGGSSSSESYPEPIADFISSGERLDLTESRAENLLNDLIADSDNAMTQDMVDDYGGSDALVQEVV
jgi:hypothetical protein